MLRVSCSDLTVSFEGRQRMARYKFGAEREAAVEEQLLPAFSAVVEGACDDNGGLEARACLRAAHLYPPARQSSAV